MYDKILANIDRDTGLKGADFMVCTFFGHREINDSKELAEKLYETLSYLIENKGVRDFYVGHNGGFDRLVIEALRKLSKKYEIKYSVVLAYMNLNKEYYDYNFLETIYPENLEKAPLRFAIDKRNRWMISKSDIVITYINSHIGGAAKYAEICEKKELKIIRLGKI